VKETGRVQKVLQSAFIEAAGEEHLRRLTAGSTAAHGDDDLEAVTIRELYLGMARPGHDFAVALDRQPFAGEATCLKQRKDGETGRQRFGLAVDDELDHDGAKRRYGRKSYHVAWFDFSRGGR